MYLECIQGSIFRDEEIEVFNLRCIDLLLSVRQGKRAVHTFSGLLRPTWTWKGYLNVLNLKKALQIFYCCFEILSNLMWHFSLHSNCFTDILGHSSPLRALWGFLSLQVANLALWKLLPVLTQVGLVKRIIGMANILAGFNDLCLKSPSQVFGKNQILAIHHRKVNFCFLSFGWGITVVGSKAVREWWHCDVMWRGWLISLH